MKIELTKDAAVRFAKGTVLEVTEEEARRLMMLRNAKEVAEKKKKK